MSNLTAQKSFQDRSGKVLFSLNFHVNVFFFDFMIYHQKRIPFHLKNSTIMLK